MRRRLCKAQLGAGVLAQLQSWRARGLPRASCHINRETGMPFTNEQINDIYAAVLSGRQAQQADAVRPAADPTKSDILPEILFRDTVGECISIPTGGGTNREVYVRRPGGSWAAVALSAPHDDPLDHFRQVPKDDVVRMLDTAHALLVQHGLSPHLIRGLLEATYRVLERQSDAVTVESLVRHVLSRRG